MLKMMRSQLAYRRSRTLAMFLGMLLATTAFTVLTGVSETSRLVVRGEVAKNFRPAYDILVRPQGAATSMEKSQGLIRESYLTGDGGGITLAQYGRVKALDGVEIAAPAAIIGYAMQNVTIPVDLSRYVGNRGSGRKVIRVDVSRRVDSALTTVPGERTIFAYVTDGKLDPVDFTKAFGDIYGPSEVVEGKPVRMCPYDSTERSSPVNGPFSEVYRTATSCWERGAPGFLEGETEQAGTSTVTAYVPWSFPYLVAAIDPVAEAKLVGLDLAVTEGRFLEPAESWAKGKGIGPGPEDKVVPLLLTSKPFSTGTDEVVVSDLGPRGVAAMTSGADPAELRDALLDQSGRRLGAAAISTLDAFSRLPGLTPGGDASDAAFNPYFGDLWSAGAPAIVPRAGRSVAVRAAELNPATLDFSSFSQDYRPLMETLDVPFRELTHHAGNNSGAVGDNYFKIPRANIVGRYDPDKVSTGSDLASVPLSLYAPSSLTGADAATKTALKGGGLAPNGSMLGYAQEPPMMLTTIDAMGAFTADDAYPTMARAARAPIGSIRVRVDGAVGIDALSRERVRKVAQEITETTGLSVDIVLGSSPTPVAVSLPAGTYGRPALQLEEGWVLKGVAVALLQAVDRKSAALFALILAVCALFVTNAATAAVRSRRTELGVLACLGWSRRMLFASILGELALIGAAAGTVSALVSWPISALAGLQLSPWRAAAAIPAAVLLAGLAGLLPARSAAQAHPGAAVRPAVHAPRRAAQLHTIGALALTNLRRVPGRAMIGALSLALGVCALTVLIAITRAFNGAATGTLLGDAITLKVRGVDYVAVAATIALGGLATADVLYLSVRERAGEFATLRAMGWTEKALTRLLCWEGLIVGGAGAAVGAAVGVGLTALFTSELPPPTWLAATAAGLVGIVVTLAALTIPAAALRRLPTAALLAQEE